MESKRLKILKALSDHLMSEITELNGYNNTLTNAVFRGRLVFDQHMPVPAISILENIDPDRFPRRVGGDEGRSAIQKDDWILLIQGWGKDDPVNPTDPAYELMADTKKALAKINQGPDPYSNRGGHANYMLDGLIAGLTMEPGTVRPPQEQVSDKAFFWMRIVLKVVEDTQDPYKLD